MACAEQIRLDGLRGVEKRDCPLFSGGRQRGGLSGFLYFRTHYEWGEFSEDGGLKTGWGSPGGQQELRTCFVLPKTHGEYPFWSWFYREFLDDQPPPFSEKYLLLNIWDAIGTPALASIRHRLISSPKKSPLAPIEHRRLLHFG
jgi:hypothetical protein